MILLLGASGYVGSEFAREMTRRNVLFKPISLCDYDYTDYRTLNHIVSPDIRLVINCAAFIKDGRVDFNESEKGKSLKANLLFPIMLSQVCELYNVPLMHISTGCLYNDSEYKGVKNNYYDESDKPQLTFDSGAGIYVASKELAEREITYSQTWKCRIRLPFDEFDSSRNYITKIMTYPKVLNAFNSISHRGDFVKACLDMVEKRVPYGIYNVVNTGGIWAETIAEKIKRYIGPRNFEWWDYEEFMKLAPTLKSNCTLSNAKLKATGVKIRDIEDAVEDALKNWIPKVATR